MVSLISKQIKFVASNGRNALIGFLIGAFLSFILIFLEPFDTNEFHSNYKSLLLLGYGFLLSIVYFSMSFIEKIWYNRKNKIWTISYEIISLITFFTVSGTILYLYNYLFVNDLNYSLITHLAYYKNIVLVFIPILSPLIIFLRNRFGERITPFQQNNYTIKGSNKKEILELQKDDLLFIKAFENYIEIFFLDTKKEVQSSTYRNTLSKAHNQLPFLEKCHRSYLVNLQRIKSIEGNAQNSTITFFNTDIEIPVSRALHKKIKSKLSN